MDFNAVDLAVAEKARAAGIEVEVQARLSMVAAFGDDEYEEGTIFRFWKCFPTAGGKTKDFQYAAIKVGRKWYTTGPSQGQYTWTDLVLWLMSGPTPTKAYEVVIIEPSYIITMDATIKERIQRRALTVDGFSKETNLDRSARSASIPFGGVNPPGEAHRNYPASPDPVQGRVGGSSQPS